MPPEPTDAELETFVGAMLSNLTRTFQEPDVLEEALRENRELWVLLYRASQGFDVSDEDLAG